MDIVRIINWLKQVRLGRFQRAFLTLPPNAILLDIGCWNCHSLEPLKRLRPDVRMWGIDRIDYGNQPPGVLERYIQMDLDKDLLPIEPESVECIRMAHILEHLSNPSLLMKQLKSVLKKNGIIYISGPNERSLWVPSFNFGHKFHGPFNFYDDPTHVRPLTIHGIYCYLEMAGFTDDEIIKLGIERTGYQCLRILPTFVKSVLLRDRTKMISGIWTLIGWTSFGIARKLK